MNIRRRLKRLRLAGGLLLMLVRSVTPLLALDCNLNGTRMRPTSKPA